jgi:dCMP deaminase
MLSNKRQDYLSWKQYFLELAILTSKRSKDPNTQVGAVIVDNLNKIVSVGYNGFPRGCSDDQFPWCKEDGLNNKNLYVVHAEINAILNSSNKGEILYTTLFPCNDCTKALIQYGIKKIYYKDIKKKFKYFS